jgi:hypothetical protein
MSKFDDLSDDWSDVRLTTTIVQLDTYMERVILCHMSFQTPCAKSLVKLPKHFNKVNVADPCVISTFA